MGIFLESLCLWGCPHERLTVKTNWPFRLSHLFQSETRYSPAAYVGTRIIPIIGKPDPKYISTSYVERQNLTMRMRMRRFTRLTNAFSKKVENHGWAVALYFMHYNFCRIHQTLRVTPAMEVGIADHVWTLAELVGLLEENFNATAA